MSDIEVALDQLTARERECLVLASMGLNSKEIGRTLGIESATVDGAIKRAFARTGVTGRMKLGRMLRERRPEIAQSVAQRLGYPSISVAEQGLTSPATNVDAELPTDPIIADGASPERQWGDLPAWQKRLAATAIAFGVLALSALLVALGRHVLGGVARFN